MKKSQKLYAYNVPVIHHCSFGCDVIVEAHNLKEAKASARKGNGDNGGYDWDRFEFSHATLPNWREITREEIE